MKKKRQNIIVLAICAVAVALIGYALGAVSRYEPEQTERPQASETLTDGPQQSEMPQEKPEVSPPAPTPEPTVDPFGPQQSEMPQEKPEVSPSAPTPEPTVDPSGPQQSEMPQEKPEVSPPVPTPEPTVDPSSTLLPNVFTFLYHDRACLSDGGHGRKISCNGSHPGASFEPVLEELLALLDEDQYQLELIDQWINPHYSGIEMYDYFYVYTGAAEGMQTLTDKYEEHEFHVMLTMTYYPEGDYFKLSLSYCDQFDVIDPGKRTVWDIEHDGEGGLLTSPPEASGGDSDFWEKCSACHGSGDCTHCGGDGEVKKFQAGLGWVELDCTLCNRGKCRHCNGTGKE